MIRAYTLAEVVEAGWAPSERFLIDRLRSGKIRGRKVGREWRMSEDDVRAYVDSLANRAEPLAADRGHAPSNGLSVGSARRRRGTG